MSVDLYSEVAASEDTIRRDLQELSEAGQLLKVHGGALSTAFSEVKFTPLNVDWEVVQIKKAMINSASKVICMTISEKLQTYQPISVCKIEKIDYLITELDPSNETLAPFKEAGVTVM